MAHPDTLKACFTIVNINQGRCVSRNPGQMNPYFKSLLFLVGCLSFFAYSAVVEISDVTPVAVTVAESPVIVVDSDSINVPESNIFLDCWSYCFRCFYREQPEVPTIELEIPSFATVVQTTENSSYSEIQAVAVEICRNTLPIGSTYPNEQIYLYFERDLAEIIRMLETIGDDNFSDAFRLEFGIPTGTE
jgi:hypothetical protein